MWEVTASTRRDFHLGCMASYMEPQPQSSHWMGDTSISYFLNKPNLTQEKKWIREHSVSTPPGTVSMIQFYVGKRRKETLMPQNPGIESFIHADLPTGPWNTTDSDCLCVPCFLQLRRALAGFCVISSVGLCSSIPSDWLPKSAT